MNSDTSGDRAPAVYVIDGGADGRAALDALLGSVGIGAEYFRTAGDAIGGIDAAARGCIVIDAAAAPLDAAACLHGLREHGIALPVIVLTPPGDVATAIGALRLGCADVLEKPYGQQPLLDAVHEAFRTDRSAQRHREAQQELQARLATLTRREWEILRPIVEGRSNRDIAAAIGLSPRTVELYRARIMRKTAAANLAELIRIAMCLEIVDGGS